MMSPLKTTSDLACMSVSDPTCLVSRIVVEVPVPEPATRTAEEGPCRDSAAAGPATASGNSSTTSKHSIRLAIADAFICLPLLSSVEPNSGL